MRSILWLGAAMALGEKTAMLSATIRAAFLRFIRSPPAVWILLADSLPRVRAVLAARANIVEMNLRKRGHARQWAAGTNSPRTGVPQGVGLEV